jgi:hypothetical protein
MATVYLEIRLCRPIRLGRRSSLVQPRFHCTDSGRLVELAGVNPKGRIQIGVPKYLREIQVVLGVILQSLECQDSPEHVRCNSFPTVSQSQLCNELRELPKAQRLSGAVQEERSRIGAAKQLRSVRLDILLERFYQLTGQ